MFLLGFLLILKTVLEPGLRNTGSVEYWLENKDRFDKILMSKLSVLAMFLLQP